MKFNGLLSLVITLIMMIVHVSGIFTRNFSGNNWRLLYTLPILRQQIWRKKDLLAVVVFLADSAYVNITGYVVSLLFSHQVGGWLYPMSVANRFILTRGELIMPVSILLITLGLLVLVTTHVVGILVKDQFTTTIFLIGLLVIGGLISKKIDTELLRFINPFAQVGLGSAFTKMNTILPITILKHESLNPD
ncbi:hypothetical protein HMPREF2969_00065 [Lactobacillus sp. HMSC056D05]|nr:hypothetical protein HMPREF2969_00065 [Lactobacillus sp. HMSC056D05]